MRESYLCGKTRESITPIKRKKVMHFVKKILFSLIVISKKFMSQTLVSFPAKNYKYCLKNYFEV